MRKLLTTILAFLFFGNLFALDRATVTILLSDKTTETRTVSLTKIGENAYRFRLPTAEIPRNALSVEVVNDWATAKKGDDGYFITPDCHLGTFRADKGQYISYRNRVCMYGMKGPKGTFVGIMKGLKMEQKVYVRVDRGVYKLMVVYNLRLTEFEPYEDIVIDYYKLEGENANYAGMAKVYRQYQLDRNEVVPLKERVKNNPVLDFTAKSIYVRIKLGRCDRRAYPPSKWGKREFPLVVDHHFNEVQDIMKGMKALNVDNAEVCLVGWQKGGHDGPFPDYFPVPQEFGGIEKMRETIDLGKSLGYAMTVHVNHTSFYLKSTRLHPDDLSQTIDGKLRRYTFWPGGQAYHACFQTVCNRYVDEDIKTFKDLGINGTFHVDVTSARWPDPCHAPMHANNRKQVVEWQNAVNQKLKDAFGGYSSECTLDHVAKTLDYGLYVSWIGEEVTKKGYLLDRPVPLSELVYHGIILSNPFYGTIDAPYERGEDKLSDVKESYAYLGTPANRMLKVVEFGGRPSFYYVDYKDLKPLANMYDEYEKIKWLQFEFMQDHKQLEKDVFLTAYSDNTRIVCNYNTSPVKFDGFSVPAKGYVVFKKGEKRPSITHSYAN